MWGRRIKKNPVLKVKRSGKIKKIEEIKKPERSRINGSGFPG